ncbi:sugar phosphate isomerase/epimerase family protein [Stieleria varia]|uniref:Xylose isomerase-like TIM barrel n=1 Tax=Stieleria varia TaxID=2528005 RepID=A0A5C6A4L5_9BACT|nr:sugar phosphate isomerase/epimerase family protein [Stieleria varia]TWT93323.1 Xylose isomerase-like TIM barrel [Stieleria varia]
MTSLTLNRRNLLATGIGMASLAALPALSTAADPIQRSGDPRFRLGLAAYSLRDYFSYMKGKPRQPKTDGKPIDMIGFLDYCVQQDFEAAELTSYFFPPDADDAYFLELKRQAFLRGVTISGTAIGNNFTIGAGEKLDAQIAAAIQWIDNAAVMGAPHIRFFAGTGKELEEHPERMDEAVAAMRKCAEHAARRGVFLGVENHGNLRPGQLLEIVQRIDSPWVGINLDTGNFISDDPYGDLKQCVGYAVNVQVKVSMKSPEGKKYPADMNRIANLLKESGYQGFVILEYEDEKPYEAIPEAFKSMREALASPV